MNIEQAIQGLTEAVTENTVALKAILAASATVPALPGVPYTEPEAKPAPAKKKEKTATAPEPVEQATVTVAADDTSTTTEVAQAPADEPADLTRDEWLKRIKTHVREKYAASGDKLLSKKQEFEAIRATFKVKLADDLTDEQFPAFWTAIQAL